MAELPLSRQPACPFCGHEAHVVERCGADVVDGVLCRCPPHLPPGIYL